MRKVSQFHVLSSIQKVGIIHTLHSTHKYSRNFMAQYQPLLLHSPKLVPSMSSVISSNDYKALMASKLTTVTSKNQPQYQTLFIRGHQMIAVESWYGTYPNKNGFLPYNLFKVVTYILVFC